jgi:hypothetical protein
MLNLLFPISAAKVQQFFEIYKKKQKKFAGFKKKNVFSEKKPF